jgi:hypothetical protein
MYFHRWREAGRLTVGKRRILIKNARKKRVHRKEEKAMTRITNKAMTGLAALFGIWMLVVPLHAAEGGPRAEMTQDVYDFGVAYEGVDVFQDISIKNTGDADLEIIRIGTG